MTSAAGERVDRATLEDHYETARPEVQALVPAGARRILDMGCSSGALGGRLKHRNPAAEVVGIEDDAGYVADAERRLDRVVQGDLDEIMARDDLATELGRFDCIVAADVLEHLRDPWSALQRAAGLLEAGGTAVVSLPNVGHWTTFLRLGLRRRWPRDGYGIFDRTHLRWFTRLDAHELVEGAGLRLVEEHGSYFFRRGSWLYRHQRLVDRRPTRGLMAHQLLLAARKP